VARPRSGSEEGAPVRMREARFVAIQFVPLALDTYFRGNSHELAFCKKVSAGGNHVVSSTAGGQTLGKEGLKLRRSDLESVLQEYARMPKEQRTPALEDAGTAQPPKRAVPLPQANGLIVRGNC